MADHTRVIQITNVAPTASKDQMRTLFGYLGRIDDVKIYPERETLTVGARIAYVKFTDYENVAVAMHLSNTVFIDRALVIVPVMDGRIPDEDAAMQLAANAAAGILPVAQVAAISPADELKRTVYVGNLDPNVTSDQVMLYFGKAGEIKYVRMGAEESPGSRCVYVEYSTHAAVSAALSFNGAVFINRILRVAPSQSLIRKPQTQGVPNALNAKEMEEAMKKLKDASSLISGAVDSELRRSRSKSKQRRSRSRSRHKRSRSRHRRSRSKRRSRSRSRRRSRSRSKRRSRSRKRSRSRSRRRSRSKRRSRSRKRSRSKGRRRSRSRSRKKSRSRSRRRSPRPRRVSRSKDRGRRRSRSRSRGRKPRSRSGSVKARRDKSGSVEKSSRTRRSRSHSPRRKRSRSRSKRSRSRSRPKKGRKDKKKERDRSRSRSKERRKKRKEKHKEKEEARAAGIKRDYDEEEKVGMVESASEQSEKEERAESEPPPSPKMESHPKEIRDPRSSSRSPERSVSPQRKGDSDLQQQDMDVSD